jgi:hypothetical protein
MTANLDIANRALQFFGSRTNMSASEFANNTSNEAIQANLIMFKERDALNRMAPWNCSRKYANLTLITSQPGTPENSAAGPPLWVPGLPPPQWAYEYQYPVDCVRPRFLLPQYTSLAGGTPIYPLGTVTGFSPIGWTGPALKYEVSSDQFFPVTAAAVATPGTGYNVGDLITLAQPSFTFTQAAFAQTVSYTMPVGAPAILQVATVGGGGSLLTVTIVNQIFDVAAGTSIGGSYFSTQNATGVLQGSTTGSGTGATFNLTFGAQGAQRVIICNQEAAILCYNTRITDPNVMDELFQDAWIAITAARLVFQLSGDKALANMAIGETNRMIANARIADGNENITVNDVTPDWLRTRGNFGGPNWEYSPNMSFDWGSFYSPY